jgi:ribosomal protein L37AE/L43A
MSLQDAVRSRLTTHDKNICPQCSAWLLAPECVRHSWSCDACGHGFETAVFFPELRQTAA